MRGEETFWGFSRFVPERGVFGELNGLLNHRGYSGGSGKS